MSSPDKAKTHSLWREKLTSQGALERNEATVAPRPRSTSSDGKAQHNSVPSDVKSERKLSRRLSPVAVVFGALIVSSRSLPRAQLKYARFYDGWVE